MAWRRGQAYGQDLRDRVLACPDMSLVQVATRFGVSPSYVSKVRARLRDLGDPAPGVQRGHVPLRLADLIEELKTPNPPLPGLDAERVAAVAVTDIPGQRELFRDVEDHGPA